MNTKIDVLASRPQVNVIKTPEAQVDAVLAAGANEIVAAVAGWQIQVMSLILSVEQPCTIWLRSGTTNRLPIPVGGKGGLSFLQSTDRPVACSAVGASINLQITGNPGANAGVLVTYRLAKET